MMPTRADVLAAAQRILGHVLRTPVLASDAVDEMLGARFYFKCENLQRGGAFKLRGATNAVRSLPERVRVIATHSSGNHGAALALAAQAAGRHAIIVVPCDARPSKRSAIERAGGEVVVCAPTLAARETTLKDVVARTGATFVPPYDDPRVIAGAGTAALELLQAHPDLDQIWVPVGGGGLAAGTVLAAGRTPVLLAEPALAGDAKASLESGTLQPALPPRTVADGLRTGLGRLNFDILKRAGTAVALASEDAIECWTQRVAELMNVVVEPSAAVTLAAIAEHPGLASGKVGVILTGGNV